MKRAITSPTQRFVPVVKIMPPAASTYLSQNSVLAAKSSVGLVSKQTCHSSNWSPATHLSNAPLQPECSQSRCLAHCWLDDEQREQGQRCLVGCWQGTYQPDDQLDRHQVDRANDSADVPCQSTHLCAEHFSNKHTCRHSTQAQPCHHPCSHTSSTQAAT
ncbi:MAG: hypothetical protein MUF72_21520 [Elainella sp. Prado103]|nr:hypothetical protein [Elainella sp. Prado103]